MSSELLDAHSYRFLAQPVSGNALHIDEISPGCHFGSLKVQVQVHLDPQRRVESMNGLVINVTQGSSLSKCPNVSANSCPRLIKRSLRFTVFEALVPVLVSRTFEMERKFWNLLAFNCWTKKASFAPSVLPAQVIHFLSYICQKRKIKISPCIRSQCGILLPRFQENLDFQSKIANHNNRLHDMIKPHDFCANCLLMNCTMICIRQ